MTDFLMTGMTAPVRGSLADLATRLAESKGITNVSIEGPQHLWVSIRTVDDDDRIWGVSIRHGHEAIDQAWMAHLLAILRDAHAFPGLLDAAVARDSSTLTNFVPEPPIARARHAVLVTDAEVAAAYDDPAVFWKMWKVEPVGKHWKLCTRALDKLDETRWLADTFESTMALVRAAKPKLTEYPWPVYWEPEMAPWWEYGDLQDEKAGFPALAPGDYDEATKTYDFLGFVTRTPLIEGGDEPRHVLVREIHNLRKLIRRKRDAAGRPVEAVRVTFMEEWMARQERRPLLDAGARVFYGKGHEITD
jgi:hypothetical protein